MRPLNTTFALGALLLTTSCGKDDDSGAAGSSLISSVTATVSEHIVTVATVTWSTDVASTGHVEFGEGGDLTHTTSTTASGTSHSVPLVGVPGNTEISFKIVTDDGAESDVQTYTTGAPPNDLPNIEVQGDGHDTFLAIPVLGAAVAAMILDEQGRVVWYRLDDRGLEVFRVRPSRDGQGVLYNAGSVSGDPADDSVMVRVSWDGATEEVTAVPALAHDFVELPDGTIGAMAVEYRDFEGVDLRGDKIVEIAPDGTQTDFWSAWDCFDPAVHQHVDMYTVGWTFSNALDYDEEAEAYYQGMRNFSGITKIDRATGDCLWTFGGVANTFDIDGSSFLHQHQFEVRDDSILLFDNDGALSESRAMEYSVDFDAGTAEEVWEYTTDPSLFCFVLGDVKRFDDDSTLVVWSTSGQIERVTASGDVTWQINTDIGYVFAFNTVLEDLYNPYP